MFDFVVFDLSVVTVAVAVAVVAVHEVEGSTPGLHLKGDCTEYQDTLDC